MFTLREEYRNAENFFENATTYNFNNWLDFEYKFSSLKNHFNENNYIIIDVYFVNGKTFIEYEHKICKNKILLIVKYNN